MKYLNILFIFILISSCKQEDKTPLKFQDLKEKRVIDLEKKKLEKLKRSEEIERIKDLKVKKQKSWKKIVSSAKNNFHEIKALLNQKCFDCHNSKKKLPFYGRVFKEINFVYKHQQDGLKALDFAGKFPLTATGAPEQLSLLRSIKDAVLDNTMPISSYTAFYPWKKINETDEKRVLNWVNPIIENIENHNEKFKELDNDGSLNSMAESILKQRCFRCHANGANKGNFSNMQNLEELLKNSKLINHQDPEKSELYLLSESGKMPPSKRESLSEEELEIILDWIKSGSGNE